MQVRDSMHHKRFVEHLFQVTGAAPGEDARANVAARAASLIRRDSTLVLSQAAGAASASAAPGGLPAVAAEDDSGSEAAAPVFTEAEPVGWLPEKFYYSPEGRECVPAASPVHSRLFAPLAHPCIGGRSTAVPVVLVRV